MKHLKKRTLKITLLINIFAMIILPSLTFASAVNPRSTQPHAFAKMLQKVMPAVVNITVQGELPPYMYPFSKRQSPYSPRSPRRATPGGKAFKFQGMGSGVIINAEKGYVVTNAHVIKDAKIIIVTLGDGRRVHAKKIGVDKASDIAVLQIKAPHLVAIPIAKSTTLKVGDFVAAIGNPFGLHQSVTSGVVSALNRNLGMHGPRAYENFIQTDAPINPGNSGGALVNMSGELVGINTAILAPVPGNIGIGFAIPSNMAEQVAKQLIKYGKVKRGLLGIVVQDLTPNLADAFHMSGVKGALVTQTNPKSAATKAGLRTKDVIQRINNTPIKNAAQLRSLVGSMPVGEKLTLQVRRNHHTLTLTTRIDPKPQPQDKKITRPINLLKGVRLQNYDAFSTSTGELKGVLVTNVTDTSLAWLGRLRRGDVILTANDIRVTNIDQLLNATKADSKQLLLRVWRSGGTLFIVIP